ncbi:MAG TPA: hypothetical protein VK766_04025, partial [Cytophagaceae bacterium]|nr:hypothetical protein [Cytophagaceae bacterium]
FYYRAYLNTNLGQIYSNRMFDFVKSRLDVSYGITKDLYIGLYGMMDSEHYYTLEQGTTPAYRENRINPVIGISLNVLFRQKNGVQQVDSSKTWLPGLPFR